MDVTLSAQSIVAYLLPYLPYLLKAVEKSAEKVGEKFGIEAWNQAKALWDIVRKKTGIKEAAQDVVNMPDDPDAQAVLRLQLKKLLIEDTSIAERIERFMESDVVQRIIAEQGSQVRGVRQTAVSGKNIRQEIIARTNSTIEDVQQAQGNDD